MGADADKEVVVILELKVSQSADDRKPDTEAVDVGWDMVQVPEEEETRMFESPEVAMVMALCLPEKVR